MAHSEIRQQTKKTKKYRNKKTRHYACPSNQVRSTIYYTPEINSYCKVKKYSPQSNVCKRGFEKEIEIQGSGIVGKDKNGDSLLRRASKFRKKNYEVQKYGCSTTTPDSKTCLIPYVSIAADLRFHKKGDIIEMPALKGQSFRLPNGKIFFHPGYLIVEDTGSKNRIKGPNRFDFYTGTNYPSDPNNLFGYNSKKRSYSYSNQYEKKYYQFTDENQCSNLKEFSKLTAREKIFQKNIEIEILRSKLVLSDRGGKEYLANYLKRPRVAKFIKESSSPQLRALANREDESKRNLAIARKYNLFPNGIEK